MFVNNKSFVISLLWHIYNSVAFMQRALAEGKKQKQFTSQVMDMVFGLFTYKHNN